ncbi:hypothetical protein JTE90_009571 [Oedothorax gibbosus]|uniref:Uncharacterized protein n=1 Tax=Oedothorax gibbosus TaxID=931172 RepID=A0AAV6VKE0_9ARAC|nr:hypothetical protein JTE90_009571 [Oedothorax gibbosus]
MVEVLRSTTRLERGRRMEDVKGDARKMQGHPSSLELESQRHTFILVDVLRTTTRQEFIGVLEDQRHTSRRGWRM